MGYSFAGVNGDSLFASTGGAIYGKNQTPSPACMFRAIGSRAYEIQKRS